MRGKIEALTFRMVQDTAVMVLRSMPDRISAKQIRVAKPNKIITDCKPIIIVNGKLLGYEETSSSYVMKIASILIDARVKKLEVIRGAVPSAIYGYRAECGVLAIELSKKSFKKLEALAK